MKLRVLHKNPILNTHIGDIKCLTQQLTPLLTAFQTLKRNS